MLLVGHTQVRQKRPGQIQKAIFLTIVLSRRHFALLLAFAFEQRAFTLFAVFKLHFVGQGQQVGILERFGQQAGNDRHAFVQREILGDIAGFIAIYKGQARLLLDCYLLDDHPLQFSLGAHVFGQHQLDKGILGQTGFQQVQKLRTMIRHRRGGGSSH